MYVLLRLSRTVKKRWICLSNSFIMNINQKQLHNPILLHWQGLTRTDLLIYLNWFTTSGSLKVLTVHMNLSNAIIEYSNAVRILNKDHIKITGVNDLNMYSLPWKSSGHWPTPVRLSLSRTKTSYNKLSELLTYTREVFADQTKAFTLKIIWIIDLHLWIFHDLAKN